ncbi:MAG: sporulation integral membrane protein YtvI, partial [Lachnospiraceae bacterium]|nr:sporulation integral membrane protein YtvI [Lachnospiraceae bacterium]
MKRWEIYLEVLCELIILALIIAFVGLGIPKLLAFLWPLVLGWIIATIAHPIVKFLEKRLKVAKKIGSAILVVVVIAIVAFLAYGIISGLVYYAIDFIKAVPGIYKETKDNISGWWDSFSKMLPAAFALKIEDTASSVTDEVSTYLAGKMGDGYLTGFAKGVTNGIIGIIVMFLSAYMFLVDWEKLHLYYSKFLSEGLKERCKLIKDNILVGVWGYIVAQFKLMVIIACVLFVGLMILPSHYALVPALLIAVLDAIPFFGVGTVLLPWAIYEFAINNTGYGVGLLILYATCFVLRHVLQPRLVGDSVGLSSLSVLVFMYVGFKLGGIIGFIIMILLGIIVKRMYESGFFDGPINRLKERVEMLKTAP